MIALDTNVLIYACDRADPRRQQVAINLVVNSSDGVLLWQVACEFVAASRKLSAQGFTPSNAWNRLAEFLAVLPLVLPAAGVLEDARSLHTAHGVSFRDPLVLAACAGVGVKTLYSEDVPALPRVGGLQVVNPFT
jgi:predicted nucleic acid-binding protein